MDPAGAARRAGGCARPVASQHRQPQHTGQKGGSAHRAQPNRSWQAWGQAPPDRREGWNPAWPAWSRPLTPMTAGICGPWCSALHGAWAPWSTARATPTRATTSPATALPCRGRRHAAHRAQEDRHRRPGAAPLRGGAQLQPPVRLAPPRTLLRARPMAAPRLSPDRMHPQTRQENHQDELLGQGLRKVYALRSSCRLQGSWRRTLPPQVRVSGGGLGALAGAGGFGDAATLRLGADADGAASCASCVAAAVGNGWSSPWSACQETRRGSPGWHFPRRWRGGWIVAGYRHRLGSWPAPALSSMLISSRARSQYSSSCRASLLRTATGGRRGCGCARCGS